jgi:GT2 family glycosyltransferase/glycosyltransferase involved in cell wall biosynthesis
LLKKMLMAVGRRRPGIVMRLRNTWRGLRAKPLVNFRGEFLVDPPPPPPPPPPPRKEIPANIRINYPLTEAFLAQLPPSRPLDPQVSIVILSYRRPDLVENLIRSIWLHTHGLRYEIIVVDNGSPLGEHDLKREFLDRIEYVRLHYNQYIGDAYNLGVERARAPYLVLMNNDIVVEPNWLAPLILPLAEDPTVGATGPKFLYPTGQLQEAGAVIDPDGHSVQFGKRGNADAPEFNQRREIDYCTGATIALRRDFYIESLGYDWRWSPGYYEDVDLCFKMRERGQSVLYIPQSTVFHIESATMSEMPPSANLSAAVDVNRRAFVEKWGHLLGQPRPAANPPSPAAIANLERYNEIREPSTSATKRVAVFFPYELVPGGGEKFALGLAEEVADDAEIVLVFEHEKSILRVISILDDLGFSHLKFKVMTLAEASSKTPFDIFILIGNELYPCRQPMGRKNYFICQFPFPAPMEFLAKYETEGLFKNFESYIVYSSYVERHVRAQLDNWRHYDVKIDVLPPTLDEVGLGDVTKDQQVIGVGRFFTGGHNKRHDVMIEAFKQLVDKNPDLPVNLCLAGASHKEAQHREHLIMLREKAADLPVKFHVDVSRGRLDDLYRRSKIYYHAAGWGVDPTETPERVEHFGITILEAMSAGCVPIVYSVGGPIEIVKHGVNGIAVGSIAEMADWTERLLRNWDSPSIVEMRANALATAKSYGKEAFRSRAREIVSF